MWDVLLTQLQHLSTGIGYSTLIGASLAVIAWFIPNEKLQGFGYNLGVALSAAGTLKLGKAWNKLEDFCINSVGQLLQGFKNGLESDDGKSPSNESSNTHDAG